MNEFYEKAKTWDDKAQELENTARAYRAEARVNRAAGDDHERKKAAEISVDRNARVLVSGKPEATDPNYREHKENGQQRDYVVLTAEERAKGFVRPVRRSYVHQVCGALTTMSQAIAETYARDPYFYSGTFCVGCGKHFPVGEDGEFVWADDEKQKVGT